MPPHIRDRKRARRDSVIHAFFFMYSAEITKHLAEGSKFYAIKDFNQAATKYADACEAYNEETGGDSADLLLLYGKALFQNGVARSGILGGIGNEEEKKPEEEEQNDNFQFEDGVAQEEGEEEPSETQSADEESQQEEGDEQDDGENQEPAEEEQSDFEAGWEILDLARSLFAAKVEELSHKKASLSMPYLKSDDEEPSDEYVVALKKLLETYDLLGEVSLESENFPQAASDLASCLGLRQQLYDRLLSALVSESHYKLSLALEFCVEDPELRQKAAEQMKLAIECVKLRSETKEVEQSKETLELLRDLEERYNELKKEPQEQLQAQQMNIIKGILGEAVESSAIPNVTPQVRVNDLSSMVKKRKAKPATGNTKKSKLE